MKILHLCTNYIGNKLFQKMFSNIAQRSNIYQNVYVPIRNKNQDGKNHFSNNNVNLVYDFILRKKDRIFYRGKIKKQLKRVENKFDISKVDLIHAHTLYSDGGTAYLLKKMYGIKYIVSIRGTDINYFYKYLIHNRPFIYKVLKNAEKIIFISEAYKSKVIRLLPREVIIEIKGKFKVIPNGIDEDWYHQKEYINRDLSEKKITNLLFAGTIYRNKNLITVLKVLEKINFEGNKYFLHVAGDGPQKDKMKKYVESKMLSDRVIFHGHLSKKELQNLMEESDIFILPSFQETFGIVYIEAMSKGLPVIYSKKEGIYGFFDEGQVGYSVEPLNLDDIIEKIHLIRKNYSVISNQCYRESRRFSWNEIAETYFKLYTSICK